VETRIGRALVAGDIHDGATIIVGAEDGELVVRWRNADAEAPRGRGRRSRRLTLAQGSHGPT
jgi:hypothetical protein